MNGFLRFLNSWFGLFAICMVLGATMAPSYGETEPAARRPNVVMVFIDDMGWGDFSCFGNREAQTPNIDKMASEGIRFHQFYVNSPICSPSRCALTTGQYPQRWKITSFLNNRNDNERRGVANWLDPKAPTLAKSLQKSGYATGHFGKWHLGGQRDVDNAPAISEYGFDQSLTNFEGMGAKLLPLTMKPGDREPGKIWENAERLGQPVTWMQRSKITSGFIDAAIPFMQEAVKEKKPFYINLWPDDVHSPFWPPVEKWKEGKREIYLSVLEEMDRQMGKIFEYVQSTDELRNNTMILICSDNGPEPGAGNAGPFRGSKGMLYEGGIRSPLVVWAPGIQAAEKRGTVNDTSVFAAFDLVPSLLQLTGVLAGDNQPRDGKQEDAPKFDGEDMSGVLLGKTEASRIQPLYWRRPPDRKRAGANQKIRLPDLAVREGKWKFLCDFDGGRPALFDLSQDVGEKNNIAGEHVEVVERLKRLVLQWDGSMPTDNSRSLD